MFWKSIIGILFLIQINPGKCTYCYDCDSSIVQHCKTPNEKTPTCDTNQNKRGPMNEEGSCETLEFHPSGNAENTYLRFCTTAKTCDDYENKEITEKLNSKYGPVLSCDICSTDKCNVKIFSPSSSTQLKYSAVISTTLGFTLYFMKYLV